MVLVFLLAITSCLRILGHSTEMNALGLLLRTYGDSKEINQCNQNLNFQESFANERTLSTRINPIGWCKIPSNGINPEWYSTPGIESVHHQYLKYPFLIRTYSIGRDNPVQSIRH